MDIFKNKVKTTKQLYEKLNKYIDVIPDFSDIKLQEIISNINKNFTQLESNKNHDVVKFILENREINTKESIRHKPNKNV